MVLLLLKLLDLIIMYGEIQVLLVSRNYMVFLYQLIL